MRALQLAERTNPLKVVVALGGNALLRRGEPLDAEVQRGNVRRAAEAVALIADEHSVIVTHGNGPQVGLLALQAEAYEGVAPYPLDLLGAESEGMIGYLLEQELTNALPDRQAAVLLTQVLVDAGDPALDEPSKPIGPVYDQETARRLSRERGFAVARDGQQWRRVVPSPRPERILEIETIRLLVESGRLVVCAGGGGIPVVRDLNGRLRGIEAVIDKDRCAARLALELEAELLLLLTDVDAVYRDWPVCERAIERASADELRQLELAAGSMGPKVEAACDFVENGGGRAAIGNLGQALALCEGRAGTQVVGRPGL